MVIHSAHPRYRTNIHAMKIGVFDSGYGGLTILSKIRQQLPQYDYLYLGDNARAPYGTRSFEVIYEYTWQAVNWLFEQGCRLVIIACNTASAKALRTIQMHNIDPTTQRVLGVIRPTVEAVPAITQNGHIGILATPGTVASNSYVLELEKTCNLSPAPCNLKITQHPCPMWVPLIEAGEQQTDGATYFIHQDLDELLAQDPLIDTIILGCTHYPLIQDQIDQYLAGRGIRTIAQGEIVAQSLEDYLTRHTDIREVLSTDGTCTYFTTESATKFQSSASRFLQADIAAQHVELP